MRADPFGIRTPLAPHHAPLCSEASVLFSPVLTVAGVSSPPLGIVEYTKCAIGKEVDC